jgi:hypothetical protein
MLTEKIEAKSKINWVGRLAYMEDNRKAKSFGGET